MIGIWIAVQLHCCLWKDQPVPEDLPHSLHSKYNVSGRRGKFCSSLRHQTSDGKSQEHAVSARKHLCRANLALLGSLGLLAQKPARMILMQSWSSHYLGTSVTIAESPDRQASKYASKCLRSLPWWRIERRSWGGHQTLGCLLFPPRNWKESEMQTLMSNN